MSGEAYSGCGVVGFIGSHLVDRLLALGREVVGVGCFTGNYPRDRKLRNLLGQARPGRIGNHAFTFLLVLMTQGYMTDGQTGIRAFSQEAVAAAEIIHDYNYVQVLTLDLLRKGFALKEVPVR